MNSRAWGLTGALCAFLLSGCQWLLGIDTRVVGDDGVQGGSAGSAQQSDAGGAGTAAVVGKSGAGGAAMVLMGGVGGAGSAGDTSLAGAGGGDMGAAGVGAEAGVGGGVNKGGSPCSNTQKFGKPAPLTQFNTANWERELRLSADGLVAYFTSNRNGPMDSAAGNDLFMSTRSTLGAAFSEPAIVKELSAPDVGDADATEAADGTTLYFDSYRPYRHLWRAVRAKRSDHYGSLAELTSLSSDNEDFEPYVTPDGSALYFSSSRPTGTSSQGFNLFVAQIAAGNVVDFNEVPGVNTLSAERNAVVSANQLTLFFASDRDAAVGSFDIYVATRKSVDAPFGDIAAVPELNTLAIDVPSFLSPDNCVLYLRSNSSGNEQLYRAARGPSLY